ncbi:homeodomain-interacting protein kinase 3-like protein [Lates japonicus]|uniref:Homeodomain-interacting protein kinase 3-like protein n=1 Tax=Lates japonicus TaxID=270547 RepID=A0AAD3RAB2_LATJO|nr:homeodomain-interacting protein kinase 3-like protein [Lates japonicus]
MGFMHFGVNLFLGNSEYHWMKTMLYLLGQPKKHQLIAGKTGEYFILELDVGRRLKTLEEQKDLPGVRTFQELPSKKMLETATSDSKEGDSFIPNLKDDTE